MKNISLGSFLFLFILKLFVAMGFPTIDVDDGLSEGKKLTATETYSCIYIPPELDFCPFVNKNNTESEFLRLKNHMKKIKSSELTKILAPGFVEYPLLNPRIQTKNRKTLIYILQKCVPSRLPFEYSWCDLGDFNNENVIETNFIYPFKIDGSTQP